MATIESIVQHVKAGDIVKWSPTMNSAKWLRATITKCARCSSYSLVQEICTSTGNICSTNGYKLDLRILGSGLEYRGKCCDYVGANTSLILLGPQQLSFKWD